MAVLWNASSVGFGCFFGLMPDLDVRISAQD